MAIRVDKNSISEQKTEDPIITIISMDITEDPDTVNDWEKKYRRITIRHNVNMKKADFIRVVQAELDKQKATENLPPAKEIIITGLGTSCKEFVRTNPTPPPTIVTELGGI